MLLGHCKLLNKGAVGHVELQGVVRGQGDTEAARVELLEGVIRVGNKQRVVGQGADGERELCGGGRVKKRDCVYALLPSVVFGGKLEK